MTWIPLAFRVCMAASHRLPRLAALCRRRTGPILAGNTTERPRRLLQTLQRDLAIAGCATSFTFLDSASACQFSLHVVQGPSTGILQRIYGLPALLFIPVIHGPLGWESLNRVGYRSLPLSRSHDRLLATGLKLPLRPKPVLFRRASLDRKSVGSG